MENLIDLNILIEQQLEKASQNVPLKYVLEKFQRAVQLKTNIIKQYKKESSDLKQEIDKLKEELEKQKTEKLQLASLGQDQANMIIKYQNELEQLVDIDNTALRKKVQELNETHDLYKNSLAAQIHKLQQENEKLIARTKLYFKDMQMINEQFLPKYGLQHLLEKIKKKEIIRSKILEEKSHLNTEQSQIKVFEKDFKQFFKDLQRQKQFDEKDLIIVQNGKISSKADIQKALGKRKNQKGKIKPTENVILIDEPSANKNKNNVQECIQIGTDDQSAIVKNKNTQSILLFQSLENSVINEDVVEEPNIIDDNSNDQDIQIIENSNQDMVIETQQPQLISQTSQMNKNSNAMQIENEKPKNQQGESDKFLEKIFSNLSTDDLFKNFDFLKK